MNDLTATLFSGAGLALVGASIYYARKAARTPLATLREFEASHSQAKTPVRNVTNAGIEALAAQATDDETVKALEQALQPKPEATLDPTRVYVDVEGRRASRTNRPVKYRDGKGNTWCGHGPRPNWVRHALAQGYELADFAIDRPRAPKHTPRPTVRLPADSEATRQRIAEAKRLRAIGWSYREIGARLGCSQAHAHRLSTGQVNGRTYETQA